MARTSTTPANAITDVVDAIDSLSEHFLAFEAVEQLIAPQKANCTEDLAHVDRPALGFLLTMLNTSMRNQIAAARAAAELAHQMSY
ncbi:hypothetical protein LHU53_15630 [Rhodoferax sp. U2-2l]|uniref:hypothetical protein n=1 Tax=Rhodoferax sp. U2-2l TaxID=2884000 RepID=UPI001D09D465|nr:hypothetical protein [Rhodoferax sp. U2-2l]MCB8748331.1 hypothetical protein [Rhodoferax sp. U2-2l]